MIRRLSLTACAALALATLAQGQSLPSGIQQSLDLWQSQHGNHWDIVFNHISGRARMLLGGQAFLYVPTSVAEEYELARDFIDEAYSLFEVESASLANERILTLPFTALGTTDKRTVRFQQVLDGIPIDGKTVNVLLELGTGKLLSIDSSAIPDFDGTGTLPLVASNDSQTLAMMAFEATTGGDVEDAGEPVLVYLPVGPGDEDLELVWRVDVAGVDGSDADVAFRYSIDAQDGSVVQVDDALFEFAPQSPPKGKVRANVTQTGTCCLPGDCCWLHDTGTNDEYRFQPHMTATFSSGHTAVTNATGVFAQPSGASLNVTVGFKGPFVDVRDYTPSQNVTVNTSLLSMSGSTLQITMNPAGSSTELDVAQANAFMRINQLRDWVRATNPNDAVADSSSDTQSVPYKAVVNGPGQLGGCNANFYPGRVKFFTSTTQCGNSAFATILWHEMGHWLNLRYGVPITNSVAGRAFHEGSADVYSLYMMDYEKLVYQGAAVRSGNNCEAFCGDCESEQACQPSAHVGGLPLMGAFWKMRANLKQAFPSTGGDLADAMLFGWLNAFDQTQIHSIIEFQLLVLDDDDGNLANGTPHNAGAVPVPSCSLSTASGPIDDAFRAHGFAGFVPAAFTATQNQTAVRICQ